MKTITALMLSLPVLLAAGTTPYEQGQTLYYAHGCGNCHGTNAEGSSYYPALANKPESYLADKLNNFKKGIAATQKQEIMFTFAGALSDKEINDVAAFLSHFKKENSDKYEVEEDLLGVDY